MRTATPYNAGMIGRAILLASALWMLCEPLRAAGGARAGYEALENAVAGDPVHGSFCVPGSNEKPRSATAPAFTDPCEGQVWVVCRACQGDPNSEICRNAKLQWERLQQGQ